MTVTVYDHPLSPYSQKVKIALLEKDVPFEAPLPEAIGSGAASGPFTAANPRGEFRREYRDHRLEWMIRSGGVDVVLEGLRKNNIRFTNVFPA